MGIKLGEFDVWYVPRTAIKSQVLADFVAKFAMIIVKCIEEKAAAIYVEWILYAYGSSSAGGNGAGILLKSPNRDIVEHSLWFGFKASVNEEEYGALVA